MAELSRRRVVSASGVPPAADTRHKPPFRAVANTMFPSLPQLAPKIAAALHTVTAGPPLRGVFLSSPRRPKADPLPVGREKRTAPTAGARNRRRTELVHRARVQLLIAPQIAPNTSVLPSGERATAVRFGRAPPTRCSSGFSPMTVRWAPHSPACESSPEGPRPGAWPTPPSQPPPSTSKRADAQAIRSASADLQAVQRAHRCTGRSTRRRCPVAHRPCRRAVVCDLSRGTGEAGAESAGRRRRQRGPVRFTSMSTGRGFPTRHRP